jgi:hypothetical protein
MTSRTSGKPDPASDDLPAPEAARGAGERLADRASSTPAASTCAGS